MNNENARQVLRVDQMQNLDAGMKEYIKKFDIDGDGEIDVDEFISAINSLKMTREVRIVIGQKRPVVQVTLTVVSFCPSYQSNLLFRRIIYALLIGFLLLIGSVFGVSIVAANLSKDTSMGINGIMIDKNTGAVAKTTDAYETSTGKIADMSTAQLGRIKMIELLDGTVNFHVKGFVKPSSREEIILIINGGTITYGPEGIADATDQAKYLLDIAFERAPNSTGPYDGRSFDTIVLSKME